MLDRGKLDIEHPTKRIGTKDGGCECERCGVGGKTTLTFAGGHAARKIVALVELRECLFDVRADLAGGLFACGRRGEDAYRLTEDSVERRAF